MRGAHRRAPDLFYSSLDPRGLDRATCGAAAAALLLAHRVWPVAAEDVPFSANARRVLPCLRQACACYDPRGAGLDADAVSELLGSAAVDRASAARLDARLKASPLGFGFAERVSAEALCDALKRDVGMLDEVAD